MWHFMASPCAFVAGVTDAQTGEPVYFGKEDMQGDCTVLRASSSIPCFAPAVTYKGKEYLDGGTSDPIPVRKALEDGCDRVVVVLTRERSYRKTPDRTFPALARAFSRYPAFVEDLRTRTERYNRSREELFALEREGRVLVITPEDTTGFSRTEKDLDKIRRMWQSGYFAGRRALEDVRAFWQKNPS